MLNFLTRAASTLLAAAVILMAAQVILRFGFNSPQAWAEEVDRYLFVWSVYLGTTVALIKGTHIRVTFLIGVLGPRAEAMSLLLGRVLSLFCFSFIAWYGYGLAWENRYSEFYTITFMPQILFYLSVPISMTVMSLYLVITLVRPRRIHPQ